MKTKNKIKELKLELEEQAETIGRLFKYVVDLRDRFNNYVIEHEDRKSVVEIPKDFFKDLSNTYIEEAKTRAKQYTTVRPTTDDFFKD